MNIVSMHKEIEFPKQIKCNGIISLDGSDEKGFYKEFLEDFES